MSEPRIITKRGKRILVSDCCDLPHGRERGGVWELLSPHERHSPHKVELTPQKLREMADEAERNTSTVSHV